MDYNFELREFWGRPSCYESNDFDEFELTMYLGRELIDQTKVGE